MGESHKELLLSKVVSLIFAGVVLAILAYLVMYSIIGYQDSSNKGNYLKRYEDGKM